MVIICNWTLKNLPIFPPGGFFNKGSHSRMIRQSIVDLCSEVVKFDCPSKIISIPTAPK